MRNRTKLPAVFLAAVMAVMYLPILMVVIYSFNASKLTAIWGGFSLDWYGKLFQDREIREALVNSLVVGGLSCLAAAVIGTLGALGNSRLRLRSKGAVEYIATLPIMIPEIILGMVFLAFFSLLDLPNGMLTLVIAHTAFCIPYIYMMVKARLVGMDHSLEEAARDLGATPVRTFFTVTLPLLLPAVASGCLLAFAMSFDDVIISIFVTGPKVTTLPVKIYTQMKTGVTPEINALCTVMLGVTVMVLLLSGLFRRLGRRTGQ
ncbi:ABC transporter permease [Cuneatibacter caecimuris]|uniref:Spermidine/putrescine transport system permease protein n=1 Tax=Cuneatibacter caecimuris TaxID=1796618 RepID=A0A4Q7P374_9FIRM|nr:spermidine/putrescine transport system permease protein [Cuneatibacter caecimuris]